MTEKGRRTQAGGETPAEWSLQTFHRGRHLVSLVELNLGACGVTHKLVGKTAELHTVDQIL